MGRLALAVLLGVAGAGGITITEVDMMPDTMLGSQGYTLDEAWDEHEWLVGLAKQAAADYDLDEGIFLALVQQESSWNPDAKNKYSGCLGLCQLNPRFYDGYTVEELLVPEINVELGASTLAVNLRRFDSSYFSALVAYNWGSGYLLEAKARRGGAWVTELPNETRKYIRNVMLQSSEE